MSSQKATRYVLVGCGGRGISMFAQPILKNFAGRAALVGICDINEGRMAYLNRKLDANAPAYKDFGKMLKETRPDAVIIATKDSLHDEFIIQALEAGCDAITEKPMTTDDAKCRAVLAAEKRTGKKITVTFNYRFVPYVTKVRELLAKKAIGKILSVDFNYQLDRRHGADYFRRWHRRKENSGGLLVHKSTHHFDLVNWFLAQEPVEVFAIGSLQFYGPTRKERGTTCRTCKHTKTCEFFYDITAPMPEDVLVNGNELYAKVEHYDGYHRDGCVFDPEIDIEDTMNLTVRYAKGVQMSYSLNAHCIYEGWRMAINGTEGRLECSEWHSGPYVVEDRHPQNILIYRPDRSVETIGVLVDHSSGHGGGDARLHKMLFDQPQPDPLGHMASSRAGAMSILTGIAANRSIASGKAVRIADLLKG
ncbi:MAG: Gfo/Idh/MocA family oxidoreductase [Verrucomicrobiae bacterium]|nr:Gfo/Idh/MocA family oxidoreductase [Verrucomicrobiae bacterium]